VANTLTSLVPTLYEALDVVSREMVGFIPAVSRNSSAERAALNQYILVPVTPAPSLADNTPAVTAPNTGDQTIGNVEMTINKSKHAPIRWNGEEQRGLLNAGSYAGILRNQFVQGFRALVNEIEVDLFTTTYQNASRAIGQAGTAPFGTAGNLSDIAGLARILDDNGAPVTDRQFVAGSAAMANIRGLQSVLFKANEAGTDELLRNGILGRLEGFDVHNSAAVVQHVKGAMTGADVNNGAGYVVGDTSIVFDGGTVNTTGIKAGDVLTAAGDANNYIVGTGSTATAGTIVLNSPGLRQTLADAVELTVGNSYTPNLGFSRSAVQLVTRVPQMPIGPDGRAMDMADDVMTITDPVSGLSFEIAVYRQFMQLVYHVRLAWGAKAIKDAHIATLMG
jgi:hypothetical protein